MDFNFWHDKFERDDLLFLTLEFPMRCVDWIRKYVRVYQACKLAETLLMKNETIVLANDEHRNINKEEIDLLLPNDAVEWGGEMFCGFVISDYGRMMTLSGWMLSKTSINTGLFITRILYYYPKIRLLNGNFQPIESDNYFPASGIKQLTIF